MLYQNQNQKFYSKRSKPETLNNSNPLHKFQIIYKKNHVPYGRISKAIKYTLESLMK